MAAPRGDAGVEARMLALDSVQRLEEQLEAVTRERDALSSNVDELDEKVRVLSEQYEIVLANCKELTDSNFAHIAEKEGLKEQLEMLQTRCERQGVNIKALYKQKREAIEQLEAANAEVDHLTDRIDTVLSPTISELKERLESVRAAAQVVVDEFNNDNPFFGYSIEALGFTLHPETYTSNPASEPKP